jgi:hypothetical protein
MDRWIDPLSLLDTFSSGIILTTNSNRLLKKIKGSGSNNTKILAINSSFKDFMQEFKTKEEELMNAEVFTPYNDGSQRQDKDSLVGQEARSMNQLVKTMTYGSHLFSIHKNSRQDKNSVQAEEKVIMIKVSKQVLCKVPCKLFVVHDVSKFAVKAKKTLKH